MPSSGRAEVWVRQRRSYVDVITGSAATRWGGDCCGRSGLALAAVQFSGNSNNRAFIGAAPSGISAWLEGRKAQLMVRALNSLAVEVGTPGATGRLRCPSSVASYPNQFPRAEIPRTSN